MAMPLSTYFAKTNNLLNAYLLYRHSIVCHKEHINYMHTFGILVVRYCLLMVSRQFGAELPYKISPFPWPLTCTVALFFT